MEIKEFLASCVDKWLGLRTTYQLTDNQVDSSRSDIVIEEVGLDNPELLRICQNYSVDPQSTLGGLKTSWQTLSESGKSPQIGSTVVVWIPEQEKPRAGKILQQIQSSASLVGNYSLGSDGALTLTVEGKNHYLEERIWFASPNLRLRTSLVKYAHTFSQTAFYSEIRRVAPQQGH
jgi:hypothetical protein